jgi:hypothetical protein
MNYLYEMNKPNLKHKFQNEIKIWYDTKYKPIN